MSIESIENVIYNLWSKGIIIVEFSSEDAAKAAINKIGSKMFKDRKLEVSMVIKIDNPMMSTINERIEDSDEENCVELP